MTHCFNTCASSCDYNYLTLLKVSDLLADSKGHGRRCVVLVNWNRWDIMSVAKSVAKWLMMIQTSEEKQGVLKEILSFLLL